MKLNAEFLLLQIRYINISRKNGENITDLSQKNSLANKTSIDVFARQASKSLSLQAPC